ncbi:FAD:protein FMN transferase [Actinospongicola halichondriae]|uniref:FAD:protein FMN transferase n=1 Tax=Actinospongicola halichondriae TaxID=3236844 RepID=UPI003D4E95EE
MSTHVSVSVVDEHRFHAMGTECVVQVVGAPDGILDTAEALVRSHERRWSRFLPDSELSALNARAGAPVDVSDETTHLVRSAVDLHASTDGWFDPLVGGHVLAAGYDRSFVDLDMPVRHDPPANASSGIVVGAHTVEVPSGSVLDLGGIAKGHTADRIVDVLLAEGAVGVCVDIGGDLRCAGASPAGEGWWCSIDHRPGIAVGLAAGAVATSTTTRRRWINADGSESHHLIDPRTGRPSSTSMRSATVVAATGAVAEAFTKVVLLAPIDDARRILDANGIAAIATDDTGAEHRFGRIDAVIVEGVPA